MRGFTCRLSSAKFLPVGYSVGLSAFLDMVGEIAVSSGNPEGSVQGSSGKAPAHEFLTMMDGKCLFPPS